jgi:hypothetical protein
MWAQVQVWVYVCVQVWVQVGVGGCRCGCRWVQCGCCGERTSPRPGSSQASHALRAPQLRATCGAARSNARHAAATPGRCSAHLAKG